MDILGNYKQISAEEKAQIKVQVQSDLVEHLYAGCLPGTATGIGASIAFFFMFYGYTPTNLLVTWVVIFDCMMLILTTLYFLYKQYEKKRSTHFWQWAYSIVMALCALAWTPIVFLMPDDITRQFLALTVVFMLTTGYAMGTIGQFYLCVLTLSIITVPATIWCFMRGDVFHYLVGSFIILYTFFMFGTNHRSTLWFKDSIILKLENTLVSYQANHDLLTDLPNQRLLPQFVDAAMALVDNTENYFALVAFSLNRMEIISDSLGHQANDLINQSLTTRFSELALRFKNIQYIFTLSRKDTFNIVIVPVKPLDAENTIKVLFSVLDEPFYINQTPIKLTASMGASLYPKDGQNTQTLLVNAEAAMLKAKHFGGNRIEFYRAEINAALPKQFELETELHLAIEKKQFQVFYQPFVELNTNKIIGMEALIRWPHPVHGFIPPLNFIPLAEETGLIVPIGEWILRESCIQTKKWHDLGFPDLKVAVNFAEKQLREDNIIQTIHQILQESGLSPQYLEVELTETAILDEMITRLIKEIKNSGMSLSVDDFGTGYSGLSYLKRFSIDKLKIDQSFIRDLPTSNDSITIVSAIIAMAKELKIKILAEGVETIEQVQFLKGKGCDFIQGYYYSKPLDASNFTELLVKYEESRKKELLV